MSHESKPTSRIDDALQLLKEGVTALLALAIVGTTLYWMGMAFGMAGDSNRMRDAKDVLALMSGLSGVVLGYYFGRVPSDARASQAQQQTGAAVEEMGRMKAHMVTIVDEVERMRRSGDPVTADDVDRIKGLMPSE
jgi:hypothetical protein